MDTSREEFAKRLWTNVKALIKKSEYTQKSLAVAMGYNEQGVQNWISGNRIPDLYYAYTMASLLGTTVDSLLGIEKDENKSKALDLLKQAEALLEK